MSEMQITEAGKQLVQSVDFALLVKGSLEKFQANGMSDDKAETRAFLMIAWAAVGREIDGAKDPGSMGGRRFSCQDYRLLLGRIQI